MSKKITLSTDLFSGKNIPPFIKEHVLFKNPIKTQKVFSSIGLSNFSDVANFEKCLVDIKKEGTYVHNLLKIMTDMVSSTTEKLAVKADQIQYLESRDKREITRAKLNDIYGYSNVLSKLTACIDPFNKDSLAGSIHITEGKVSLRLMKDIDDLNGKVIFRKDKSLFSIFNSVKEKCAELGVPFDVLEQNEHYKIFHSENIPNKEYSVVFSSEGSEGSWDILTMSMRGVKSCQRWGGEYPRCLIGSIMSKFVGVIYLTSGVPAAPMDGFPSLGTKMMRRCVIRYAVDADEDKPCILVDKMYPEFDKDVLGLFTNAIKARTELPIHYSPDLGNRSRHIYIPSEKLKDGNQKEVEIIAREASYMDTPLKSKQDLYVYLINSNKEEVEREIKGFRINLSLFLAKRLEDIYSDYCSADQEIKKTVSNIRMNTSFTPFCEQLVSHILNSFRAPVSKTYLNSKSYYRKYLMEFLMNRKTTMTSCLVNFQASFEQNMSRKFDIKVFTDYIFSAATDFAKIEAKRLIN